MHMLYDSDTFAVVQIQADAADDEIGRIQGAFRVEGSGRVVDPDRAQYQLGAFSWT